MKHLLSILYLTALVVLPTAIASQPAVAAPNAPVAFAQSISSEQIRDASKQVMQQHDYRSVRRRILENTPDDERRTTSDGFLQTVLGRMGDAVGDFVDWVFSGLFSPRPGRARPVAPTPPPEPSPDFDFDIGRILLVLALGGLVGVIVWILAGILKASDGRRRIDSDGLFDDDADLSNLSVPPGELAASTYETRALKMAESGNFQPAIRELLLGSMSWVERAGMIRFRKGLTNRDYIRAVWRDDERRYAFGKTALEFERIYFGRREATREMFDNCLQAFQGAFREETTTQTV